MSYSIPVSKILSDKVKELYKETVERIMDEQILISQLSNGITYQDTENMDAYERTYILEKLISMEKDKIEAKKQAIAEMKHK